MNDDNCPGCGSSPRDRARLRADNGEANSDDAFKNCPRCGSEKCCVCDMGDDVECVSCGNPDHGDD